MTKVPLYLSIIAYVMRGLLKLRYHIEIENPSLLLTETPKLFLPNHASITDPLILTSLIYKYQEISPVIDKNYLHIPVMGWIIKRTKAVPVPDFIASRSNNQAYEDIKRKVKELLSERNVLLYPSGHLCSNGHEVIRNKKSTWEFAREIGENAQYIGVTIEGLWGSSWGRYRSGKTPRVSSSLGTSIVCLLGNFFFLVPKRKIKIKFENISELILNNAKNDLASFNKCLEDYYNRSDIHKLVRIKYFFWQNSKTYKP